MTAQSALRKPAALVVLDGWGWREDPTHNAIAEAHTPYYDRLLATCPHTVFDASGIAVGLPEGQMGNSEIGHMSIGAGMPIDTDLVRINKAIAEGTFATTSVFDELFQHVASTQGVLHVIGLLSDGGIHSHEQHIYALVRAAHAVGVKELLVHVILDGRDAAPQSGAEYLARLERVLKEVGLGRIASISGRYFAMDRDNNWDRVDAALRAIADIGAEREVVGCSAEAVLRAAYQGGVVDELFVPMVLRQRDASSQKILTGDAVIVANFRADRARMLTRRLVEHFGKPAQRILLAAMTEYDQSLPVKVAFPPMRPERTLAGEIARAGLTQVHIAETEKYAHATYFLNGGREEPHAGEEFVLIESRKDVATHDLAPEMRAREIADAAVARIEAGVDFVFINFANADMVGHTANVPAIRTAVETIDHELARVVAAIKARGGFVFITADHGNAEQNFDVGAGVRHTAHTLNEVPAILTDARYTLAAGSLPDVAPTVLALMGLSVPSTMTGVVRAQRNA